MLPPVLLGVDQSINDFGLVFAFDIELARRSAPANGKQHGRGQVGAARCPDLDCGAALSDTLDLLAVSDLQASLSSDVFPNLEQLFLAHRFEFERAAQRQSGWRGHNDLAAREMRNGAAKAFLLDRQKTKPVLNRRKACRKSCRSGAHDDHIISLGKSTSRQFSYGFDGLAPLLDRVANKAHAAKLTSNEDPRNVRLKI